MSNPLDQQSSGSRGRRPRQVTLGGMQAVAGSVTALFLLITTAQQLNDADMTRTLTDIVHNEQLRALDITVDSARTMLRYAIMVLSVLSAASFVLGVFVLRRHRPARVALTVIGGVVGVVALLAGPVGWVATLYIGVSVFLLWSGPARDWFSDGSSPTPPTPPASPWSQVPPPTDQAAPMQTPPTQAPPTQAPPDPYGPPQGPRRDVGGALPPAPPPDVDDQPAPPPPPPPQADR